MEEEWRTCLRDPDYQVSSLGRVRNSRTGRVLKPTQNHSRGGARPGYLKVSLGRRVNAYVHTLVAEAWHGPRVQGHDADHIDWDRLNNRPENLRWLPQRENRMRWAGPGRHDFVVAKHEDRVAPEGHVPMTEQETEDVHRDLTSAGW